MDKSKILQSKFSSQIYAEIGELNHTARELQSAGLAPGSPETLAELSDPILRPRHPSEPIASHAVPTVDITLDKDIFGTVIRDARRGVSAGIAGLRNEYLRLSLDDDLLFDSLYDLALILARDQVPTEVSNFLKLARLTALLKPNGRIRGISSGDTFRRLVSKTIARQKQAVLRTLVEPHNFGISAKCGTDGLIHLIQFLLDEDPLRVLLSIDGVAAFYHVCRARIFEQLLRQEDLHSLVPFV